MRLRDLPDETGGGVIAWRGDRVWIFLDRSLSQAERRCVLGHEVVHLERGRLRCDWDEPMWSAVISRQELDIDREVARRLVPADELDRLIGQKLSLGQPVVPFDVEEEFDVDGATAQLALELAQERHAAIA